MSGTNGQPKPSSKMISLEQHVRKIIGLVEPWECPRHGRGHRFSAGELTSAANYLADKFIAPLVEMEHMLEAVREHLVPGMETKLKDLQEAMRQVVRERLKADGG